MTTTTITTNKPILITTGEPAGIGMDVVLILANQGYFETLNTPVLILCCHQAMQNRLTELCQHNVFSTGNNFDGTALMSNWQVIKADDITDWLVAEKNQKSTDTYRAVDTINVPSECGIVLVDIPTMKNVQSGRVNIANADMVMKQLKLAHTLALKQLVLGIVTAPIQKSALIDANLTLPDGTMFSGHTEYFMQMSGCKKVVMMLANSTVKVALVTTHLPLSQVAVAITKDEVRSTVAIVLDSLTNQFGINKPKVLVCGLNPHAGEGGHLGMEEIEVINPVLRAFQQAGHDVSEAMPADTLYTSHHLENCDATIAMYHDQGLPVLKSHGFGDSVNITLGLPYVRTSVDHGTALDKAGKGDIDVNSLKQAIIVLKQMSAKTGL